MKLDVYSFELHQERVDQGERGEVDNQGKQEIILLQRELFASGYI